MSPLQVLFILITGSLITEGYMYYKIKKDQERLRKKSARLREELKEVDNSIMNTYYEIYRKQGVTFRVKQLSMLPINDGFVKSPAKLKQHKDALKELKTHLASLN